jgi:hypothetical protein
METDAIEVSAYRLQRRGDMVVIEPVRCLNTACVRPVAAAARILAGEPVLVLGGDAYAVRIALHGQGVRRAVWA